VSTLSPRVDTAPCFTLFHPEPAQDVTDVTGYVTDPPCDITSRLRGPKGLDLWDPLGTVLGGLGAILGALGPSCYSPDSRVLSGELWQACLGQIWLLLEPLRALLGASWGTLGAILGGLDPSSRLNR
jgi:hypothetical protein